MTAVKIKTHLPTGVWESVGVSGLQTHLAEIPAGQAPGRLAKCLPSTGRPRAQQSRGVIWGGVGYLVPAQLPIRSVSCSRG